MKKRRAIALACFVSCTIILIVLLTAYLIIVFQKSIGINGPLLDAIAFERKQIGEDMVLFEGELQNTPIKIRKYSIEKEEASQLISSKLFLLTSLFDSSDSPYPDLLTNTIRCTDEFKPRQIPHTPFDYWKLYATERLTYGACSWDLLSYQAIMYFQQCDDTLYQIELFVPLQDALEQYESAIQQTRCG